MERPMIGAETQQAFISKDGTYAISCPSCLYTQTYRVADIPPNQTQPFSYTCPCGQDLTVRLVGFRNGHRRRVNLTASLVRTSDPLKIPVFATVEDISISGMRIVTERLKGLARNEILKISCMLDDPRRTRLNISGKIRRVMQSRNHLSIALEYLPLTPDQRGSLDAYMTS